MAETLKITNKGTVTLPMYKEDLDGPWLIRYDNKVYKVSQNGDVLVRRERGIGLGDVRLFWATDNEFYDTPVLYTAERKFGSIIPFRAPKIWWRRINLQERFGELEAFVDACAGVKNHEGWQGEYFRRAKDISKKGFLQKLKGENYE